MYVKEVVVQNQVGLHARPATFLSKKQTNINHPFGLKRKNAGKCKSLLGVLSLGIVEELPFASLQTVLMSKPR
ncbi:MAG: HPr family phosphocarrier protein [Acutalibacteraceae bacterium]